MARYHGRRGRVYMSTSGTGAAAPVSDLADWTITTTAEKVETPCFEDNVLTRVQGLPDLSLKLTGFWSDSQDVLYDAADSPDGVKVYIYPSADAATKYWYGPAWITVDETAGGTKKAVTTSASGVAAGSWGRM